MDSRKDVVRDVVEEKIREFLESVGRAEAGTIWNVVDVLNGMPGGHQLCFEVALEMQNRDLVKLLYSLYPGKVMVEMTLLARDVALKM